MLCVPFRPINHISYANTPPTKQHKPCKLQYKPTKYTPAQTYPFSAPTLSTPIDIDSSVTGFYAYLQESYPTPCDRSFSQFGRHTMGLRDTPHAASHGFIVANTSLPKKVLCLLHRHPGTCVGADSVSGKSGEYAKERAHGAHRHRSTAHGAAERALNPRLATTPTNLFFLRSQPP